MAKTERSSDTGSTSVYENLLDVVRSRRSVRKFRRGRNVPRETFEKIMEAGRWAPSGANAQPWDFICVDDPDVREQVRQVFLRQGARLDEHTQRFPDVKKRFMENTVAIILVVGDERFKSCFPQGATDEAHQEYAENNENIFYCSLGAAIQNIQLATVACGLTSAWLSGGGEKQTSDELREVLGFPTSARPFGTIPIGYPEKTIPAKWRRPLGQTVHWNRFEPEQYRPQNLIDYYISDLRSFAMYRPFEHMEDWGDYEERVGSWKDAFTTRVTNPSGQFSDE